MSAELNNFAKYFIRIGEKRDAQFRENMIELLSRAMCQADGYDPNQVVLPEPHYHVAFGSVVLGRLIPQWELYSKYAVACLDAEFDTNG